jgi:hypothetical protein
MLDMNLNGNDSHVVGEALAARGITFFYSTGNTSQSLKYGYSDRPVLKKPFKYEELAAILARLKLAPIAIISSRERAALLRPQHGVSCFNTMKMSSTRRSSFSLYSPTEDRRRDVR